MDIIYALNKENPRYYHLLFASLRSLFRVHKKKLNVYLIYSNLTEPDLKKLDTLSKSHNQSIRFIKFPESKYKRELSILMKVQEKFSNMDKGTFYRLFIAELMPKNVDRVLYLDCDTLINKNLESFYNTDFEENSIIAITDLQEKRILCKSALLPRLDRYYKKKFNAGVFILNLKSVRKNFLRRFLKISQNLKFLHADQDMLNIAFVGESKILDQPEFNLISTRFGLVNISLEEAYIIHLAGDFSISNSTYNKEINKFIEKNYKDLDVDITSSSNTKKITRFLEKKMPQRIYDLFLISIIAFKIVILNKEPSQPLFE